MYIRVMKPTRKHKSRFIYQWKKRKSRPMNNYSMCIIFNKSSIIPFQAFFYYIFAYQLRHFLLSLFPLPSRLRIHCHTLASLEVFIEHVQIISTGVEQVFLQLVLPLPYHLYHCLYLIPSYMVTNLIQHVCFHNTCMLNMSCL